MKVVETLQALRAERAALPGTLGLVPTMGYLHAGHLSLVGNAKAQCTSVAASIFVNPAQFGPAEDLASYPRNLTRDLALLEAAEVDLVWTPAAGTVYPADFQTWVVVEGVAEPLEGAQRPGHFRGVATVVAKLFNAFQPDRAYFGQKDAQQVAVIRQMVRDLNFPLEVVVCPTMRESDGLAMSSRNAYLTAEQRAAAPVQHRALSAAALAFAAGERDADGLRALMIEIIAAEPLARCHYASCADPLTMQELYGPVTRVLLSLAVSIGKTRLIDNLVLEEADHAASH